MASPEIAVAVTTYQKPWHLRRALASIAAQQGIDGKLEVVVTDDGSTDETAAIVEQFRRCMPFPVAFTTHPHSIFQPARSRNEGAQATTAPYLLYVDGDCVLPPDHVAKHLAGRKPNRAMLGDCYRVEQELSATLSEEGAARGDYLRWDLPDEQRRLDKKHRKMRLYSFMRHPTKPRLISNNVGLWRSDLERVNGFDENFRGWGQEDDDLGYRLKRAGVRLASILGATRAFHLWHPRDPTATVNWREGVNVAYFLRAGKLVRCRNGMVKRSLGEVSMRVVGRPKWSDRVASLWRETGLPLPQGLKQPNDANLNERPEVEILCLPGAGRFSGRADCQVLIVAEGAAPGRRLLAKANRIVADQKFPDVPDAIQFRLSDLGRALDSIT